MRSPTDRVGTGSALAGASDGVGAADAVDSGAGTGAGAGSGGGGAGGVAAVADGPVAVASFGGAAPPPHPEAKIVAETSTARKLRGLRSGTLSSNAPFIRKL